MDGAPGFLWLTNENRDKKQIPFGDDNKKSNGYCNSDSKDNCNRKGKSVWPALR
jgi:hypothetical protein